MLKQRLKEDWLGLMDRNSKYFYSILKAKQRRSNILSLTDEVGNVLTKEHDIQKKAISFIKGMLGIQGSCSRLPDPEVVSEGKILRLSVQMDNQLVFSRKHGLWWVQM